MLVVLVVQQAHHPTLPAKVTMDQIVYFLQLHQQAVVLVLHISLAPPQAQVRLVIMVDLVVVVQLMNP